MARTYTLKRRAAQQSETRRRIVEAALDLHASIGPAFTSLSQVAARAGVQRNTLYAHFPDERSLYFACSELSLEQAPLPDPAPWREIGDRGDRLREGLGAIYAWYEHNAELARCVMRDAEIHPLTREIVALRFGPRMAAYRDILGAGLRTKARAMLHLAIAYTTWRTLTREGGLKRAGAAAAMAAAIEAADET